MIKIMQTLMADVDRWSERAGRCVTALAEQHGVSVATLERFFLKQLCAGQPAFGQRNFGFKTLLLTVVALFRFAQAPPSCPTHRHRIIAAACALVMSLIPSTNLAEPTKHPLLLSVDTDTSVGHIITTDLRIAGALSNLVTIYSWSNGNYLAENRLTMSDAPDSLTNAFDVFGKWLGTNWTYKSGQLFIHESPGPQQSDLLKALGGRFPAEHALRQILARGIDYDNFKTIHAQPAGLVGLWGGAIPFQLEIQEMAPDNTFAFAIKLTGNDSMHIQNTVTLQEMSPGIFIPESVIGREIHRANTTNVYLHKQIISAGTNMWHANLDPLRLFPEASVFARVSDKLFAISNSVRVEIPSRPIVQNSASTNTPRMRLVVVLGIATITFIFLIVFLLQRRRVSTRTQEMDSV